MKKAKSPFDDAPSIKRTRQLTEEDVYRAILAKPGTASQIGGRLWQRGDLVVIQSDFDDYLLALLLKGHIIQNGDFLSAADPRPSQNPSAGH